MAGDECDFIAQRPESVAYGVEQRGSVASRKIGAADRPLEQHIAHQGKFVRCVKEHHMAGGVARAMQHLQADLAEVYGIAIVQPAIGCEGFRRTQAKHASLACQLVQPELVGFLRSFYGDLQLSGQFGGTTGMIDVAMSEQDFLGLDAGLGDGRQDAFYIPSRIDDGGLQRVRAP